MPDPKETNPTADYRKYPKGPNFLLIVILASISILVIAFLAVLFLKKDATKVIPHSPSGQPNSRLIEPAHRLPALDC